MVVSPKRSRPEHGGGIARASAGASKPEPWQPPGVRVDQLFADEVAGPPSEEHRRAIRMGTKEKIATKLGLEKFGGDFNSAKHTPPESEATVYFMDGSAASFDGIARPGGKWIMGRYDIVCVRANADFDMHWRFISGSRPSFWVVHAAAINVGESERASDFEDFRATDGTLNVPAYLSAMKHIFANALTAGTHVGAEHLVMFPFGMGAFIRLLHKKDPRFKDKSNMMMLREGIAEQFTDAFVEALSKEPRARTQVHICLFLGTEEARSNADAWARAVRRLDRAVRHRFTLWPGADSLQLAHELTLSYAGRVALVNGANRSLLGNHWFSDGALRAIDENLHRRSWRLSAMSYTLNGLCGLSPDRTVKSLYKSVLKLGGQVHALNGDIWSDAS